MGINNLYQEFEYSASDEGCFTYNRMVIQLEDCFNVLKAIHPGIDFIFLFDHSCGNYRGIKDGLNVMKVNSRYGRAQREMHQTNINQKYGYLGPYAKIIEVRDEKHMISQESESVPCWMNPKDILSLNNNKGKNIN